jgi:hypothetical protein
MPVVDPYDDPKTTRAMCDAIDGELNMTDVQQAVPVATDPTLCMCENARRRGVAMLCLQCTGPVGETAARLTEPARKADRLGEAEALADAVATALSRYAVAYTHVTLTDMSTAGRSWKVHETGHGNPFDHGVWLGEFDTKEAANGFCADLRRSAAITAAHLALATALPDPTHTREAERDVMCRLAGLYEALTIIGAETGCYLHGNNMFGPSVPPKIAKAVRERIATYEAALFAGFAQ